MLLNLGFKQSKLGVLAESKLSSLSSPTRYSSLKGLSGLVQILHLSNIAIAILDFFSIVPPLVIALPTLR
jgi:hypothetical protein